MADEREFDMMVVGELNVDLILDRLNKPPATGEEQRAGEMTLTLGSSTAIFASNATRLGSKVAFCGKVGTDSFGEFVLQELAGNGVHSGYVMVDEKLQTGASIIIHVDRDRMMVTHPGAMEHLSVDGIPGELFEKSRHIHTSSIFFQPELKKDLELLFQTAKNHGLTTSMDTQWDPDERWDLNLEIVLPLLDFFLPNEQELIRLTDSESLEEALHKLSGYDTCVVVKRGSKGAVLQLGSERHTIPAWNVPGFVDAIGAGDSFNAGFIHEFLNGKSIPECLFTGNLAAAVSTTSAGGTGGIESYRQVMEMGRTLQYRDE